MTNPNSERARHALSLLLRGQTPEEVEEALADAIRPRTALSDPTNVQLEVVTVQARGPVKILGVTTRTNTSTDRACPSCLHAIDVGVRYERVARDEHTIESYHVACFEDEFGKRALYGD
jgi:hypothetical protein